MLLRTLPVVLVLVACGGEAFESSEFSSSGSSAGAGGGMAGGSSSAGSSSSGGRSGAPAGDAGASGEPAAGSSSGGAAGSDGGVCASLPLPHRPFWIATAVPESSEWVAANAIDDSPATRFSTGEVQAGNEWLQIDLGTPAAVSRVELDCCTLTAGYPESLNDYARGIAVRVSDQPQDVAAPVLGSSAGGPDSVAVELEAPAVGRYVLITQTGTDSQAWWSVHDVRLTCGLLP